jgi:hypothetical protein
MMSKFTLGSPRMRLRRSNATGLRSAFGPDLPVGHRESTESALAAAVCCAGIDLPAWQSVSSWSDGSTIRHCGSDGYFRYASKPAIWGTLLGGVTTRAHRSSSPTQPRIGRIVDAADPVVMRRHSGLMRSGPETDCRDAARKVERRLRRDGISRRALIGGSDGEGSGNCSLARPPACAYHGSLCHHRSADDTGVALPQERERVCGRPPLPAGRFSDENGGRGRERGVRADGLVAGDGHFESAGTQNPLIRIEISATARQIPRFASLAVADMGSGQISGNPVASGYVSGVGGPASLIHYQDRLVSARQPT